MSKTEASQGSGTLEVSPSAVFYILAITECSGILRVFTPRGNGNRFYMRWGKKRNVSVSVYNEKHNSQMDK